VAEAGQPLAGLGVCLVTSVPGAAADVAAMLEAAGAQVVINLVTGARMAETWGLAAAVPVHCLFCTEGGRTRELATALAAPHGSGATDSLPLLALGDGLPEGLPDLAVRQRTFTLLPTKPAAAQMLNAMMHARARLLRDGEVADQHMSHPRPAGPALRVLVADDNRVNRAVMQKILQRAGHAAVLVEDGEAALDALESTDFDLVLMDVNMPGLDGITATKLYRFASLGRPHVPVIGVTADATPEAARRSREAGMDACLIKPIEPERLVEAIATYARPGGTAAAQVATPPARQLPAALPVVALDPEVTGALKALGGREFAAGLAQDFLEDAEHAMERLKAAAMQGDVLQFRNSAHALRSSAANIGAVGVFDLCRAAEAVGPDEIAAVGPHQVALLAVELARVRQAGLRL
jgi:two-component system sensor histidine kinase RpfC